MNVVNIETAAEFLERGAPLLLADEARHNLILALAGTLRDRPAFYPDFGLWLVEDAGEPVAAALRTRPYNLVLARGTEEAVGLLGQSLDEELPGVVGARPEVDRFVAAHGLRAEVRFSQGIYAVDEVIQPRPAAGAPREATDADRELLLDWWHAFTVEALRDHEPDRERLLRSLEYRLTDPDGGIAVWEDEGRPVSAVGYGSPTPTGIRIGPVYTPPRLRGRGYASALTAHVSAEQLESGRSFCFLYTDLANPTSNKIYTAVGYRRVCDSVEYAFV
jgi:uncharacterized protein